MLCRNGLCHMKPHQRRYEENQMAGSAPSRQQPELCLHRPLMEMLSSEMFFQFKRRSCRMSPSTTALHNNAGSRLLYQGRRQSPFTNL